MEPLAEAYLRGELARTEEARARATAQLLAIGYYGEHLSRCTDPILQTIGRDLRALTNSPDDPPTPPV